MPLEEGLEKINQQRRLMYYFQRVNGHLHNGLDTVITMDATNSILHGREILLKCRNIEN